MTDKNPLHRNHRAPWTIGEITFVEENFGSLSADEIAIILGRSVNGVRRIITLSAISRNKKEPWAESELEVLRTFYQQGAGLGEVMALLPHRTMQAIRHQASILGVTGKASWNDRELRFLKKHYGTLPTQEIAARLGRSVSSVRNTVNKMGLTKKQQGCWTKEEMAVLAMHYDNGAGIDRIQTLLPKRTRGAIAAQASKMGLTDDQRWHPDDITILRQYYPVMGIRVEKKLPGRSRAAIKGQVAKLGLQYDKYTPRKFSHRRWSKEELSMLQERLHWRISELIPLFPGRTGQALQAAKGRFRDGKKQR